jgi:hypothetical protein
VYHVVYQVGEGDFYHLVDYDLPVGLNCNLQGP